MPRKPKNAPPDDSELEEKPGEDLDESPKNPRGDASEDLDEEFPPELLESDPDLDPEDPPAEERIPHNRKDIKTARAAKEEKMAAEGKLKWLKIVGKRLTPDKVKHPAHGFFIPCAGQMKKWEGQYTDIDVETMAHDYYGGGKIVVTAFDPENSMKYIWRRSFDFPGEPNTPNIVSDCMTSEMMSLVGSAPNLQGGAMPGAPSLLGFAHPQPPEDPAKKIEQEARLLEAEGKKAEAEVDFTERRLNAQKRIREMKRRSEEEERQVNDYQFGTPDPRLRRGRFGLGPEEPFVPEMDRPITTKDMIQQQQLAEIREHNRRLEERLERLMEARNHEPKTSLAETVAALMAAAAPIMSKMMEIQAENSRAARNSTDNLVKTLIENGNKGEKTMELMMTALGFRDKQEVNKLDQTIKLIELGKDIGGGGDSDSIIEQIGRAGGDLIGGITAALAGRNASPAPAAPPRPAPAASRAPLPVPGASIAGYLPNAQAAKPQPQSSPPPPPTQPPSPAPAAPAPAQAAPAAESSGETEVTDTELKVLAKQVVQLAAADLAIKPEKPRWVEVAFQGLPDEWVEMVANAGSYEDLTEFAKPYAPYMDLMTLYPRVQADAAALPWLQKGFAQLQELCRKELHENKTEGQGPVEGVRETTVQNEQQEEF